MLMCQKKVIAHSDSNSQLIKLYITNPKEFFAYKPQYKYLNTAVYIYKKRSSPEIVPLQEVAARDIRAEAAYIMQVAVVRRSSR